MESMDVTLTLGQLIGFGATLIAIIGLVGPGMFKLGTLTQKVDDHDGKIDKLFKKFDELLTELRKRRSS